MSLGPEIREVMFTPVRFAEGYDVDEVDALLDTLAEAADRGEPLAPLVERMRLRRVRMREGYAIDQVDDFLERITGVRPVPANDPTSSAGPVVQKRRGLFARMLGRDS